MLKRVVVSGIGVVAPNGVGKQEFSEAIYEGRSGIRRITLFDPSKSNVQIAGEVIGFDPSDFIDDVRIVRRTDRFAHLGLAAAKLAIEDAGISATSGELSDDGVIIGSGQGGLLFHEQTILDFVQSNGAGRPSANAVPKITANAVSAFIAIQYGIRGLNQVISTACSSGAQAIGQASRMIKHGICKRVITGGVEAPISPVMIEMYHAMMVLAKGFDSKPHHASRPFDKDRAGFVLGEGAGMLVLEELENARRRHAPIYAEVVGFGTNCGAYHMVTPCPSGEDAAQVMQLALTDANMPTDRIDYISAHGTGTQQNDLVETRAIKSVFGKHAYLTPISSIKSMIGHTIGASGALNVIAGCLAIQNKMIPPTINLLKPDPECDLDYVPNHGRRMQVSNVLSNSFGFGSNNAALILAEVSDG